MRASFPKAQLYLFPELFLTGEHPFHPDVPIARRIDTVPGPLTERDRARSPGRAKRWIQAGSIYERSGRRRYNTALLFAPDGSSWCSATGSSSPGCRSRLSDPGRGDAARRRHPAGRQGRHDDLLRRLVPRGRPRRSPWRGAEVILHPTMTSTPDREEELVLARANAIVNQCYVLNVNAALEVGGGR